MVKNIMKELQKPFRPDDIEWRVQRVVPTGKGPKAIVLAYVTNRAIMNRLDEVFGVGNWRNEYKEWREKGILCGISAKIDGEWVTKYDGAEETNIEAVKGGFSGSMKRAAVQWGIGRYLYDLDETWVEIKEKGDNYINDKKANAKGYWDTPVLPSWAVPKVTLDSVYDQWIEKGGTEDQFNDYIQKQFNIAEKKKLKQSQLFAIQKVLEMKSA